MDLKVGLMTEEGQRKGRRSLRVQRISKKGLGRLMGGPQAKATRRRVLPCSLVGPVFTVLMCLVTG